MLTAAEKDLVRISCFLFPVWGAEAPYQALKRLTQNTPNKGSSVGDMLRALGISTPFLDGMTFALTLQDLNTDNLEVLRGYEAVLGIFKESDTIG